MNWETLNYQSNDVETVGYVQIIKEGNDTLEKAWYSKTLMKTKLFS